MSFFNIQVRNSDNYLDGTRLAQVLNVKVSNWRASLGFSSRLQKIQEKTGLEETQLYQARKKYPTFIHPLLALDMVEYSKASNKNEVRQFVTTLVADNKDNDDDESLSESEISENEDKNVTKVNCATFVLQENEKSRLVLGDVVVIQREDGMIDLTAICKAGGKKFTDWFRLDNTQKFLQKKMYRLGFSIDKLVSIGDCTQQSSFGHPQVAIHLASWVSPSFADLVTEWVHMLLVKGSVSEQKGMNELELKLKFEQLELDKKKWNEDGEQRSIRNMQMRAQNIQLSMDFVKELSGGSLQPNDREFYKELMLNVTKNNTSLVSVESALSTLGKGEQVTLSIIANRMGYKLSDGDLCQLGKLLARRYRDKHNREPEKHTQRHQGRMIPVNTYFECDIPLMEKAVDEYFNK